MDNKQINIELCGISGHDYSEWRKEKYDTLEEKKVITDYSVSRYNRLPVDIPEYELVPIYGERYERHCNRCGYHEYSKIKPVDVRIRLMLDQSESSEEFNKKTRK